MHSGHHIKTWIPVCNLDDIVPNTGVCALINGEQVAVFAINNYDPSSEAAVLSRGLIGNLGERIVVASPIYKYHFDLQTGECLEAPEHSVCAYLARINGSKVWVAA